jgi:chemotaxis protein MotB
MARMLRLASLTLVGFSLTGCVAQEKYNALKLDRDGLVERLAQADAEARTAKGESDILKNQLARINSGEGSRDALVQNLHTENSALQAQLADLNKRYEDAIRNVGSSGAALPIELTNALETFAQQNPGIVDFDSARGMVKFRSDLTFATGSAEVTDPAKQAIARFAQILNSPTASGYELMVAGHTDNKPVNNPETIRRGHLDNWYLSSHRAISVGKQLQSQGVSTHRIAVVGYADQRPISDNASDAGRQQNRRVEVLILPTRATPALAGARQPAAAPAARPAARGDLNKDTPIAPAPPEVRSFDNK